MGSIFLSYRRDDAEGQAGRLYDDLVAEFGSNAVFMDVAAIEPGRDFRRAIDQSLSSCGVFLALIGRNWLAATDAAGRRRLDDPADFVRIETAAALRRDIPVIPVLVQGATALSPDQLPDDIRDLAYRNAMELTHARWDSDVKLLVKAVRGYVSVPTARPEPVLVQPGKKSAAVKYFSLLLVALFLLGVVLYSRRGGKAAGGAAQESTETTSSAGTASSAEPEPLKRAPEVVSEQANAPATKPAKALDFSLAAEQVPLPDNPKRFTFTLSTRLPSWAIDQISGVHYDLVYTPNPLSLEGGPAPKFSAVYEGWGCYQTVVVSVHFKASASKPLTKTFDMCKALSQ